MATSTLRALILAVVVALGVLGLTKLFPTNASIGVTPSATETISPTTVSPSGSPSVSPSASRKPRKNSKVTLLVLNATTKTGLAGAYRDTFVSAKYKAKEPADFAGPDQDVSIIYYREDWQPEAEKLKNKYLPTATLQPAPASLPADVQIEVVLGSDAIEGP